MFKNWFRARGLRDTGADAWPPLPTKGYLLGRAATEADLDLGDAVFFQTTDDGREAEHYPIALPQYALWQVEDGPRQRVFVVQAEKHVTDPTGEPIYGLRTLDGESVVAMGQEARLLGTVLPTT